MPHRCRPVARRCRPGSSRSSSRWLVGGIRIPLGLLGWFGHLWLERLWDSGSLKNGVCQSPEVVSWHQDATEATSWCSVKFQRGATQRDD